MSRLEPIEREQLNDRQKGIYDSIVSSRRGGIQGPFLAWLESPELADRAKDLGEYLRFDRCFSQRLAELAILVVGRHWTAQFEFYAHARLGRQAGLEDEIIDAIRHRRDPVLTDSDDQAVYGFAKELVETKQISDATFAAAEAAVGKQGVVDLVALIGYYTLVSMTLNTYQVPIPDDAEPLTD